MSAPDTLRSASGASDAADAVTSASEREEAARNLVSGDAARRAAADALVAVADVRDEHDSGSEAPGDVADGARSVARAWRRLARRATDSRARPAEAGKAASGDATDKPAGDAAGDAMATSTDGAAADAPADAGHANGTSRARRHARMPQAAEGPRTQAASNACPAHATAVDVTPEPAPHEAPTHVAARAPRGGATRLPHAGTDVTPVSRTGEASMPLTRAGTARTPGAATHGRRMLRPPASRVAREAVRTGGRAAGTVVATTARGAAATSAPAVATAAAPAVAVAIVLATVLLVLLTLLAGGAADEDRDLAATRLAERATAERERTEEEGDRGHGGGRYRAYTGDDGESWDADFVSWCIHDAGLDAQGLFGRFGDVGSYLSRATSAGVAEVHAGDGYAPVAGDLAIARDADGEVRIAIVTDVSDDGTATCVGGDRADPVTGSHDRGEDGRGGYVVAFEIDAGATDVTFVHPPWSAEAAGLE